jgi:hypothetical protein
MTLTTRRMIIEVKRGSHLYLKIGAWELLPGSGRGLENCTKVSDRHAYSRTTAIPLSRWPADAAPTMLRGGGHTHSPTLA